MNLTITIPTPTKPLWVPLAAGGVLFVVGANGTGKSSLMFHLASSSAGTYWAAGHRQMWLESGASDMNRQEYDRIRQQYDRPGRQPALRWSEPNIVGSQRTKSTLHALHNAQRARDRRVVKLLDSGSQKEGLDVQRESQDPLDRITQFFKTANLPITLSLDDAGGRFVATRDGVTYPINELSDGERSALLLAAAVVSEPEGTLFLIDEPERHLHRSIICPLLEAMFTARQDCRFVIATHELLLPLSFPESDVLILRRCIFQNSQPAQWEADRTSASAPLSDELKANLWGGRRRIVFVEGGQNSLDIRLYRLLFTDATIYPKNAHPEVVAAVKAIAEAEEFTWVKAVGLVDGDRTPDADKDARRVESVHSLDSYAIESLYYHPRVQREVAGPRCKQRQVDIEERIEAAARATVQIHNSLDTEKQISRPPDSSDQQFAEAIITRIAIKKTDIPKKIAQALMFRNRREYENAVLDRVGELATLSQEIISLDRGLARLAANLQGG